MNYYDYHKILTYNAMLNFLIGERGVGKSYGITKHVVKKFLENEEEFAYVRRYKTELKKSKGKFFDAIKENNEFPDTKMENVGDFFKINEKTAGYAMTLSTAQDLKSTNFPKVKYIIFDEFVIEKGQKHYLQEEVRNFLGIVETIARTRDVKIFLLGNSADIINPYFLYFNITLPYNSDIVTYKDGLILVQHMKNLAYREEKKKTKFGKLISGTEYEEYAIENKFINDNKDFIEKKTGTSIYRFAFYYKNETIGVWFDYANSKIYMSKDTAKPIFNLFSITLENHTPNTMFIKSARQYQIVRTFIERYKTGDVFFENTKIKNFGYEIIKLLLT